MDILTVVIDRGSIYHYLALCECQLNEVVRGGELAGVCIFAIRFKFTLCAPI